MRVITIATCKGGQLKTTTSQFLTEYLRQKGFRVLGVDLDTQANLTYSMKCEQAPYSVYDVATGRKKPQEAIYNDFLRASEDLTALDVKGNPTQIKNSLDPIKNKYDFVIIDTPPKLDNILIKALVSSDYVILPTFAEAYSIKGIERIIDVIEAVQQLNTNLKIGGLLLTMYNPRSNLLAQLKGLLESKAKEHNTIVFKTTISRCVALAEAQALQEPLLTYKPQAKAILEYKEFTKELLQIIK